MLSVEKNNRIVLQSGGRITCWTIERRLGCWHTLEFMKEIRDGAVRIANVHTLRPQDAGSGETVPAAWLPGAREGRLSQKLVGYFQTDTGTINRLVHLWKFDDDADRRKHWAGVFADKDFVEGFASRFRPLVMTQEVNLLTAAPWGPHP